MSLANVVFEFVHMSLMDDRVLKGVLRVFILDCVCYFRVVVGEGGSRGSRDSGCSLDPVIMIADEAGNNMLLEGWWRRESTVQIFECSNDIVIIELLCESMCRMERGLCWASHMCMCDGYARWESMKVGSNCMDDCS